ncbi:MAG: hypothetical protein Tsb0015_02230 [Simkaniaceae bacterium]
MKTLLYKALLLIFFLSVWEFAASFSHSIFFPHIFTILEKFFQYPKLLTLHMMTTASEMGWAIFWSFLLAFPISHFMVRYPFFKTLLDPFFLIFQSVPMFALAPLMILCFGWTAKTVIIPTVVMIIFPLSINLYRGLNATPQSYVELFTVHHATKWQIFWKLRFPFSIPFLFSGLRISAAIAAAGTIAGEWIGGQSGLGVYLQQCRFHLEITGIYAALLCLILFTLSCYGLVGVIEKIIYKRMRIYEKTPLHSFAGSYTKGKK